MLHNDILIRNTNCIEKLSSRADNAISSIYRTINRLKAINEELDDTLEDTRTYVNDLLDTCEIMENKRNANKTMIKNFSALLGDMKEN